MLSRKIILSAVVAAFAMAPSIASAATNLITNGDFSAGNSGFTTGYNYVAPAANIMYAEGNLTIAANPFSVHNLWVPIAGSNPMLIANGSPTSNLTIWQESAIAVTNGGKYNFGADVMKVCCNADFHGSNSPSTIKFQVSADGGATWTDLVNHTTTPPADAGVIAPLSALYTATSSSISLRAINSINATSGNDFALDNLTFASAVPEPGTWAMLFLGFGAIGLMMRRRQTRGLAIAAA
jgi:hypothetical protein